MRITAPLLTSAIAAALAAPVLAASQLERSLGVGADIYSATELARIKFASDDGKDEPRLYFDMEGRLIFSMSGARDDAPNLAKSGTGPAPAVRVLN